MNYLLIERMAYNSSKTYCEHAPEHIPENGIGWDQEAQVSGRKCLLRLGPSNKYTAKSLRPTLAT